MLLYIEIPTAKTDKTLRHPLPALTDNGSTAQLADTPSPQLATLGRLDTAVHNMWDTVHYPSRWGKKAELACKGFVEDVRFQREKGKKK